MLEKISIRGFVVLIIASIGIFVAFSIIMNAIRTLPVPTYNIIDLEFAWTGERASIIMQAWGAAIVTQELLITYLDFGYLAGYGLMAFWLLALGARLVQKNEKLAKAALVFMFLSILSPVCDIIENANLIPMMEAFPAIPLDTNALVASVCATIKFGVLFLSISVFAFEIIHAISTRYKK